MHALDGHALQQLLHVVVAAVALGRRLCLRHHKDRGPCRPTNKSRRRDQKPELFSSEPPISANWPASKGSSGSGGDRVFGQPIASSCAGGNPRDDRSYGLPTITIMCVRPRLDVRLDVVDLAGWTATVRSIAAGRGRAWRTTRRASRVLRGRSSSGGPNVFHASACCATMRSVTFSPPPPIMIGRSPTGGGLSRESVHDRGQVAAELAQAAGAVPNS